MKPRSVRKRNSGQVLVIVSLIITMLLFSTALYVAETEKSSLSSDSGATTFFSAYKLGSIHTLMSALANISNGGSTGVLIADLTQFQSIVTATSYNTILRMDCTPLDVTPYCDGVWITWGSNGTGISSVCANFVLNFSSVSEIDYAEYALNVTSELAISGQYALLLGASKQLNLTCRVLNEGKPALAQNFTVYYEQDGSLSPEEWVQVASPSMVDYGNGTYTLSFTANTANLNDPLLVSVHCHDLRGIFTKANVTCTQV